MSSYTYSNIENWDGAATRWPGAPNFELDTLLQRTNERAAGWRARFVELLNQTDKTSTDVWGVYREVDKWLGHLDCQHTGSARVSYPVSNGIRQRSQCTECGQLSNFQQMDKSREYPMFVDVVTPLKIARDEMREYAQHMADQARRDHNTDWWRWYVEYLKTPEWKAKRDAVLKRDGYQCTARLRGCAGSANQVHHLTYDHAGNEPLFELVSICENCHNQLTEADRARR